MRSIVSGQSRTALSLRRLVSPGGKEITSSGSKGGAPMTTPMSTPMTTLLADKKISDRTVVGDGAFTYEPVENWAKLPPRWSFKEIGGVGVDKNDNVYVFNRGEHPMIVFDRDGNF